MKLLSFLLLFCIHEYVIAQDMNNDKLLDIITKNADSIQGTVGSWQFMYKERQLLCITDPKNNRMRIMSPITQSNLLDKDLLLDSMMANFHSALDVKYAIANDVLWSVFIHPLRELSTVEVESALSQVYFAAKNFGGTFSSTKLIFGVGQSKEKNPEEEEEEELESPTLQKF